MFGKFNIFFKKPVLMLRDDSGVSVIFGALLLLAIFAVFLSAFLITAIPAKIMSDESAGNDLLLSEILQFSESEAFSGSTVFHSDYSTVQIAEGGEIVFAANISVPPETESFLKSDYSFDSSLNPFSNPSSGSAGDFALYKLSSGSLLFSCRYSQIPDRFYSFGDSSLLLIQEGGSSFLKPPAVRVWRNKDDKILFSMRGDVLHFPSSSSSSSSLSPSLVFSNLTTLNYRIIQTADVHDFVSEICIFYLPPESDSFLNETAAAQKEKAFQDWLLKFENELNRDFPELKTESDFEKGMLVISSDSLFEIDVTVREIEYVLS